MTKLALTMNTYEQIITTANKLNSSGLSVGNSGNVSARTKDGFLITPSGLAYNSLNPGDIVELDLNGLTLNGTLKPSSEWHFHCAIYKTRPEINAIVHTHSKYATALACTNRDIPAFHYMVAVAGGINIRCAEYATFGSSELANNALIALKNRTACLLAHHGSIALSTSTSNDAFVLATEVENLAAQYCEVIKIGGITIIDTAEMNKVIKKFEHYGQNIDS